MTIESLRQQLIQEIADIVKPKIDAHEATALGGHVVIPASNLRKKVVPVLNDKYQELVQPTGTPFIEIVQGEIEGIMKNQGYTMESVGGQACYVGYPRRQR